MDKSTARNVVMNARMNTYDIAHSIYLATAEGISGANQNDGLGFALSAIAELWNIRGTVDNPEAGRTRLTGRYRGMGVTEEMIYQLISRYPDGFPDETPYFDALLLMDTGSTTWDAEFDRGETWDAGEPWDAGAEDVIDENRAGTSDKTDAEDTLALIGFIAGLIVAKGVLHLGWIISIILAFLVAGVATTLVNRRG